VQVLRQEFSQAAAVANAHLLYMVLANLALPQVPASGHTPGAKPTTDADSKKLADALTSGNSASVAQSLATSYEGESWGVCLPAASLGPPAGTNAAGKQTWLDACRQGMCICIRYYACR
jgi:hypothetical protein